MTRIVGHRPYLPTAPSRTYYATQIGAELGQAVAPAGDVNGDGYDHYQPAADVSSTYDQPFITLALS